MDAVVTVERDRLSVCAEDTVHAVLDALRRGEARELGEVLGLVARPGGPDAATGFVVAEATTKITCGGVAPRGHGGPAARLDEGTVLGALETLGAVVTDDLASDAPLDTYLDEGREFTAVRVPRPFHDRQADDLGREHGRSRNSPSGRCRGTVCPLSRVVPRHAADTPTARSSRRLGPARPSAGGERRPRRAGHARPDAGPRPPTPPLPRHDAAYTTRPGADRDPDDEAWPADRRPGHLEGASDEHGHQDARR